LDSNNLLRGDFIAPQDFAEYILRSIDLTEEGLAVMRCGFKKWLLALDRGTIPEKASALEKC
jgi:hypothetical protein